MSLTFWRKPKSMEVARTDEIAAGQKWVLSESDGSPWPREKYAPVTILDAKDGWVRYSMGGLFKDQRMPESTFRDMYRRAA
jgi:hypothetical protein